MDVNPKQRRRHTQEFKTQVLAACSEPGMSVAAVARSFGLNDNLLHQWRRGRGASVGQNSDVSAVAGKPMQFIAMSLPAPVPTSTPASGAATRVQVQVKRGALVITVDWPLEAAAELGAWTRELLK